MKFVPAAALAAFLIFTPGVAETVSAAEAQTAARNTPRVTGPAFYRGPILRFNANAHHRGHRHRGWRHHRHHRHFTGLPVLSGPAVIYQNGAIEVPDEDVTGSVPQPVAQPVIYRVGEPGSCDLERVRVRGERGRTTVNVWRC